MRRITHYLYPSWPDMSVPRDPSSLCDFTENVRQHLDNMPSSGPAIVHCRSDKHTHMYMHIDKHTTTSGSFIVTYVNVSFLLSPLGVPVNLMQSFFFLLPLSVSLSFLCLSPLYIS